MATRRGQVAQWTVAALLALAPVPAMAGGALNYAGTVRSVESGSFVIQDVGPRPATGEMHATNRRIVLTPSTTFVMARRARDGASAFPGDYAVRPAERSDLAEGDFVSVECQPTGAECQAIKLTIVQTGPPA